MSNQNLSIDQIQEVKEWIELCSHELVNEIPAPLRDAVAMHFSEVYKDVVRQEAQAVITPTLAISRIKENSANHPDDVVAKAVSALSNPENETGQFLSQLQAEIEWVQPFSDGLFDHVSEIPDGYIDQFKETIESEINQTLGRGEVHELDAEFGYCHDLMSIMQGRCNVSDAGDIAKAFCGGRGVLNQMLREEANDLLHVHHKTCDEFIVKIVGKEQEKPRKYSMSR